MSSIVSALTGGGSGTDWKAKEAQLVNPATQQQATDQYGNLVNSQQQQQAFLNAVQAQNGLGNQSSVFNQMQNVASGQGPNPAQAQLANATGANVANQAALMAGQRGSGANAGMMARQAAQQGANLQQQAAGQGAALQAQQSLGALNQMGGIANQQAAQQANAVQGVAQGAQNAYGQVTSNINAQNQAAVSNASQANQANADIQKGNASMQGNILGGLTGAAGTLVSKFAPIAGQVIGSIYGGPAGGAAGGALGSALGSAIGGGGQKMDGGAFAEGGPVDTTGPRSMFGKHLASGGKVPAMVSPGEKYLTPAQASQVVQGKADPMSAGKTIPGKPVVPGARDSYANDIVPAKLEVGGIVIPRSVTQSDNAEAKAQAFVKAHFAQRSHGKKRK